MTVPRQSLRYKYTSAPQLYSISCCAYAPYRSLNLTTHICYEALTAKRLRVFFSTTSSPNEGTSSDGARLRWGRCAIGDDRRWAVRAHARDWLSSVLQSRRCVYPVGVTDGGLPLRVMSELAPITLGRDVVTSDLSRYHARCSRFFVCLFFRRTTFTRRLGG